MAPSLRACIIAYTILAVSPVVNALTGHPHHHLHRRLAPGLSQAGCFSSPGSLVKQAEDNYDSSGFCGPKCKSLGFTVIAEQDKDCYCGNNVPPSSDKVSQSECSTTCPGYPSEFCGGPNAWTVYTYGTGDASDEGQTPSGGSSPAQETKTRTAQATVTLGGSTVFKTLPPTASPSSSNGGSSGPSKAGIAAGVVVGLLVLAAAIAGIVFYLKKRKAREEEEGGGHRRASSVNAFVSKGAIGTNGLPARYSIPPPDARLDPRVMVQKRNSGGSVFADNEDYSRRILRVANPDG